MPKLELLAEHGEVQVLVRAGDSPTFTPKQTLKHLCERLRAFNPEQDFLVWAGGDTLAAVLVGVALERLGHTNVRWLRYERGRDPVHGTRTDEGAKYRPVDVPLYSHEGGNG